MSHLAATAAEDVRPVRLVLVVDDEEAIRAVVRRALERVGWTVEQAADGPSALHLLRSREYDWQAILLDLTLPGLHGQEVYEKLVEERPDLVARLAFTSGAPSTFAAGTGRPLLQKPFEITTLRDLVDQLASTG